MKVNVLFSDMDRLCSNFRETGFEMERIRLEAERQVQALAQVWQGEDSAAFKQGFYAPGGLNEFCTCLKEGHLSFYRFADEAWTTYFELGKSIHASQEEASRKS